MFLHDGDIEREFAPLEAIADNYEKIVISTDSLISFNHNGIKQKNIIDFYYPSKGCITESVYRR